MMIGVMGLVALIVVLTAALIIKREKCDDISEGVAYAVRLLEEGDNEEALTLLTIILERY